MTVAEVERWINGAVWRLKNKASLTYTLADLIGVSTARNLSSDVEFPSIAQVFPELFEEEKIEEDKEQAAITRSQNNFMAFALKFNAKQQKGVEIDTK